MIRIVLSLLLNFVLVNLAFGQSPMPDSMEHEHKMIQIPESALQPKLDVRLYKDTQSGFNLVIETQNFELEPPELAGDNPVNVLEGHAHVFINGDKVYRAYGRFIHLPANLFVEGVNQVMVSLNDHDHNTWSRGAKMVMATMVIDTRKTPFQQHHFAVFSVKN